MKSIQATSPRFDWYSGSFDLVDTPWSVFDSLVDEKPRSCRPRMGYERAKELRRGGVTVARIMSGSKHEYPYVEASGQDAVDLANLLRDEKIFHTVARADACADVNSATAYSDFEQALLHELPPKVTRTQYSQTKHGETASTLYLGSRKSEAFARLYEKGKESPETYPADTVRIEVQTRPKGGQRKVWAASATPHEIMSVPGWASTLLALVDLERLPTPARQKRVTDLDGALSAMGSQYGRRVQELLKLNGGDLEATWDKLQEVFFLSA